jgi:hypothetical protein
MDERIEKSFEVANYMATLSNQRRLAAEEFSQKTVYYINGATFKITPELIGFVSTMADRPCDLILLDSNNFPIKIETPKKFLADIISVYNKASKEYFDKFTAIKSKRKIADMVDL